MKNLRSFLQSPLGRVLTIGTMVAMANLAAEPANYLFALDHARTQEADTRAIANKMGLDPEFLLHPGSRSHFHFASLFAAATVKTLTQQAVPQSIADRVAQVKQRYALVTADTTIAKIASLVRLAGSSEKMIAKNRKALREEFRTVLGQLDRDALPPLPDTLPGIARSRHQQMESAVKALRNDIKRVLNNPGALDEANVANTLLALQDAGKGSLQVTKTKPRWNHETFPVKDVTMAAPVQDSTPSFAKSAAVLSQPVAPVPQQAPVVPAAVKAQADVLKTPAKIFTWVHDKIRFEAYSGVAKGSEGTLAEGSGNDWDQAILLRDMLAARGYQAQLEWGTVTLPVAQAMNLVGTEDPIQAANLLATAGYDGRILTTNGAPANVQLTHAWVRAFLPYLPNRGATEGTADTWVRMDPSFKRHSYSSGIATNNNVRWNEDEYLQTSSVRPPQDFFADKLWSYIRAAGIVCQNLSQVAKSQTIVAENYPYVPATLTTRIDSVAGTSVQPPAAMQQRVTITLTDESGATIATTSAALSDVWGKKLSLNFTPATPDDAAIIQSYGDLYSTPAYLIRLQPQFALDDQVIASGSPVAAGAALQVNLTFAQPGVAEDTVHHSAISGETHAFVLDAGRFPDTYLQTRINRAAHLTDPSALASEQLYLDGIRYMQHVDDGITFASGVRWQRSVKRVFEADARQQIDVTYNVAGAAIRLRRAEKNLDVSRLLVGIIPITNDTTRKAETLSLAGLQSSYLEGSIWEEMDQQQGISAAKALLLARAAGQTLLTVDSGNIDTLLPTTTLPPDVQEEIRGAVAQGRIAKIPTANVTLNRWSGTGYILEDPTTGAATYPISGGLAGGSETGQATDEIREMLGSESWLEGSPVGDLLRQLLALLGGGGGGSPNTPSTSQSDPVNTSSGNMYRTLRDVSIIARGIPIGLTRTYNSRSSYNGPFGYGWTCNYDEQLVTNDDGSVTYREADGTEHLFTRNAGGTFISPPGKHLSLAQHDSSRIITAKDGTQFGFDDMGSIVSQRDLNGNVVTINRDMTENLTSIVDATGRTALTFTVTGGKITQVTDLANRAVTYAYTSDDLTSVTDSAGKVWSMTYDLAHNMTSLSDPLGNSQRYEYDTDDRLAHHIDAVGAEEFFHFDIAARQSVVTDRRGGDRYIQFDDSGRATLEADPAGNVVKAAFDDDNNRTQTIDSRGNIMTYEYDAQGNTKKQVSPDGRITLTTYDEHARPVQMSNTAGSTTTNVYDATGNLTQSTRVVNGTAEVTTNTYDGSGQLLSTTDPRQGVTSMTWNANGALATRSDPSLATTTIGTDALGHITSVKDAIGNETKLTYDAKDRIQTMSDPYNNTTSFAYDDAGRRTAVITPRGTTTYTYDGEGRVRTTTDPLGNRTATTYDAAGDVLVRTDARGGVTKSEYDANGRVMKMTDANGGVWSYLYCASVGTCQISDPNGNVIKQEFDIMGRVVKVTDSLGHVATTLYDKAGRKISETDANGNTNRFSYDDAGRLTKVTEANGAVTSYTYDATGNKIAQTDANNHTWTYQYDALNRLVKELDPLQRATTYAFDAIGNLKTKTDAKGQVTTYTYNVRRLTNVAYAGGADTFTYDQLGRRSGASNGNAAYTYSYDALNRLISSHRESSSFTLSYTYDANGNRTALGTGGPDSEVRGAAYLYDAKNRLTKISDATFGDFTFQYDAMDRRTELRYPNGMTTSYTYDNAYRLTAMVSKNPQGLVVDAWRYTYDAVGNRLSKTDLDGKVETYGYDNVYRLTDAHYGDGSTEQFTYDAAGNRLSESQNGAEPLIYSYDVANEMLKKGPMSFSYDANGNTATQTDPATTQTTSYQYDGKNELTHVDQSYTGIFEDSRYNPDGSRVFFTNNEMGGGVKNVQYDPAGNPVLDEYLNSRSDVYRLYGPGVDEPLGEYFRGYGRATYLLHDGLGSVTAITNKEGTVETRQTYRAFGQMTRTGPSQDVTGHPPSRLAFTSRENSVLGLMQYRSRYYSSETGRFVQQDTYRGQLISPPSLQRYVYALNSPVNYTDPSGQNVIVGISTTLFAGLFVLAMITAMVMDGLGVKRVDLIGHFESGFAATYGGDLLGFLALSFYAPFAAANVTAAIAGLTLVSILIGTFLEATFFNTGGFSSSDWFWQTLGAVAASVLVLLMLQDASIVAEMEAEVLFPIAAMIFVTLLQGFYYAGRTNFGRILGINQPQPQPLPQ